MVWQCSILAYGLLQHGLLYKGLLQQKHSLHIVFYTKIKSMLDIPQKFKADRNTIVQTEANAELAIDVPEKYTALLQQQKEGKASKHCKRVARKLLSRQSDLKQHKADEAEKQAPPCEEGLTVHRHHTHSIL